MKFGSPKKHAGCFRSWKIPDATWNYNHRLGFSMNQSIVIVGNPTIVSHLCNMDENFRATPTTETSKTPPPRRHCGRRVPKVSSLSCPAAGQRSKIEAFQLGDVIWEQSRICLFIYMYLYIYIYCVYIFIYIYIYHMCVYI